MMFIVQSILFLILVCIDPILPCHSFRIKPITHRKLIYYIRFSEYRLQEEEFIEIRNDQTFLSHKCFNKLILDSCRKIVCKYFPKSFKNSNTILNTIIHIYGN